MSDEPRPKPAVARFTVGGMSWFEVVLASEHDAAMAVLRAEKYARLADDCDGDDVPPRPGDQTIARAARVLDDLGFGSETSYAFGEDGSIGVHLHHGDGIEYLDFLLDGRIRHYTRTVESKNLQVIAAEDAETFLAERIGDNRVAAGNTRFAQVPSGAPRVGRAARERGYEVTVPFKPGDRIRLKANHAIEAVVLEFYDDGRFDFAFDVSRAIHHTECPDEWERVPQPMPTLEPGMVVEYDGSRLGEMKDAVSIAYCFGTPEQRSRITRVGRVEWIWERDDAHP